jgi:hypothetical protein
MVKDFKEQLKDAVVEERKKLEEGALDRAEGMIKSLVNRDEPAHESFREELKTRIMDARHAPLFMRFFQMKVFVPAMAMLLLLSLSVGAYKLGAFDGVGSRLAKLWPENLTKTSVQPEKDSAIKTPGSESFEIPKIEGGDKLFAFSLVKPAFASFETPKEAVVALLGGERADVAKLSNLSAFEKADYLGKTDSTLFSNEQRQALTENNFFLTDNFLIGDQRYALDDFVDTYDSLDGGNIAYRSPENSIFITSDYALHLYHLLIDRSFQAIEETKLQPRLLEMTSVLYEDSLEKYRQATDPAIKDSYKRLAVYYLVPLSILKAGVDAPVQDLNPADFETFAQFEEANFAQRLKASQGTPDIIGSFEVIASGLRSGETSWIYDKALAELQLIAEAKVYGDSPLFTPNRSEFRNDYTQFTPRSHYTKNKVLKTYFMSMMWYGRMGFVTKSPEQTRDALVITGQVNDLMVGGRKMSDLWSETMALIDFFVGETDDLTPYQYTEVAKKVFGEEISDKELSSEEMMRAFKLEAGRSLNGPKILSEVIESEEVPNMTKAELLADTMQFRFMGQRFTPDAYILNQLTQGAERADEETGQRLPSTPTALMPISIIEPNNSTVKGYLDEWVRSNASDSDKIIAKTYDRLVGELMSLPAEQWNQNIYWSWLDCYRPLLKGYGQGYPYFMKDGDWNKKNLGTVLGSYAELKHDTLLYAKQSYAELGGGPGEDEIPPVPKGYVEADPVFWSKILSLAKTTEQGLTARGFMPDGFAGKYESFIEAVEFFKDMAKRELRDEVISDEDFERLRTITSSKLSYIATPADGGELQVKDRRSGLIADIHTDALKGQILYEATGKPKLMYVAVSDANGTRLTVGAVFSQYEFSAPLGKRLTDEDWQALVYEGEGQLPAESPWTKEITR